MNLEEIINAAVTAKLNEMIAQAIRDVTGTTFNGDKSPQGNINSIVAAIAEREIERRKGEIEAAVIESLKSCQFEWSTQLYIKSKTV